MTAPSKRRRAEFVTYCFKSCLMKWHIIMCPHSLCNHTEQSGESGVKALWGAIWAISKQHLPQPRTEEKSFPQRSWAHFEHIIVLLFPYSLITVQSDYRVENKGRGWQHHPLSMRWMQVCLHLCQLSPRPSAPCLVCVWIQESWEKYNSIKTQFVFIPGEIACHIRLGFTT